MPLAGHQFHRALSFGLVLMAVLLLAGCVNVGVESEFHADGSADHTLELRLPRDIVDQVSDQLGQEINPDTIFEAVEQQAAASGLETERIETTDEIGIRITAPDIQDNSDLGAILMSMLPAQVEAPTGVFEGSYTVMDGEYHLDLTVDGSQLVNQLTQSAGLGDVPMLSPAALLDISYTATLPGRIDKDRTNGQVVSSDQVRWSIGMDEKVTMTAVATDDEGETPWLLYGIAGAIVLALLAGVAVLLFVITGRKGAIPKQSPTSSQPTGSTDLET